MILTVDGIRHPHRRYRTRPQRLRQVTDDAIYRDDDGTEYVVQWPTQQDVDLARRITEIAADHQLAADPASVSVVELGLDAAASAVIAPVWAALLTGNPDARGGRPAHCRCRRRGCTVVDVIHAPSLTVIAYQHGNRRSPLRGAVPGDDGLS